MIEGIDSPSRDADDGTARADAQGRADQVEQASGQDRAARAEGTSHRQAKDAERDGGLGKDQG